MCVGGETDGFNVCLPAGPAVVSMWLLACLYVGSLLSILHVKSVDDDAVPVSLRICPQLTVTAVSKAWLTAFSNITVA